MRRAKLRLLAAFGALVMAAVVVWQSAPPATSVEPKVELQIRAAPMDPPTTMKSPIVATTDPSPLTPCRDIPLDVVQRLRPGLHPADARRGAALPFDAGNYQLAVEPIIWRKYDQSLPADAVETTINGHRAAQWWNSRRTYPQQLLLLLLHSSLKTSYRVVQRSLFYSTIYSHPESIARRPTCSAPTSFRRTTSSEAAIADASMT